MALLLETLMMLTVTGYLDRTDPGWWGLLVHDWWRVLRAWRVIGGRDIGEWESGLRVAKSRILTLI